MSHLFCDSSVVVKRYITEVGSNWVEGLCSPTAGHTILLSEISIAEVAAALSAKQRAPGGISQALRDAVFDQFVSDCSTDFELVSVRRTIINKAAMLTRSHRLRGYDAVQLATALSANVLLLAARLDPLIVITADTDLRDAADSEGLESDNPLDHP